MKLITKLILMLMFVIVSLPFAEKVFGATFYVGTSPTTSFSYSVPSTTYSEIVVISTTTYSYLNFENYCASYGAVPATQFQFFQIAYTQTSTTYPLVSGRNYYLKDKTFLHTSIFRARCVYTISGTNAYISCGVDSGNNYTICVNSTTPANYTTTGTYYGYNDTLFITESEGGGGDMLDATTTVEIANSFYGFLMLGFMILCFIGTGILIAVSYKK